MTTETQRPVLDPKPAAHWIALGKVWTELNKRNIEAGQIRYDTDFATWAAFRATVAGMDLNCRERTEARNVAKAAVSVALKTYLETTRAAAVEADRAAAALRS